jgi:cell division protein FtsW
MTRTTLPPAEVPTRVQAAGTAARISLGRTLAAESSSYFLLLGTTLFLVAFGVVMVLSSSSVESFVSYRNSFSAFISQGGAAVLGVPAMLLLSRARPILWHRLAMPALAVAAALELLVFTPLGYESGGNRNWLNLGFVTIQPSEVTKLALVLWLGKVLSTRDYELDSGKRLFWLIVPVSAFMIGLVLLGRDLGTAIIMAGIVLGALFFAGVRLRFLVLGGAGAGIAALILSQIRASRVDRINAWLSGCQNDYLNTCWQVKHGTWALAAGGVFGVGLGNSKAKWSWLPEADNDFIFAVIGEELGLLGAIVVLLLFVVLAFSCVRILQTAPDQFSRIVTSAIMVWLLMQALVNIAVVLGVLPVLGVPLPLISAGGTSLMITLCSIGVVLSVARAGRSEERAPTVPTARRRPGLLR